MNEVKNTTNETVQEEQTVIHMPLKKPIKVDGKEISEMTLDFSSMKGTDILSIDQELRMEGHPAGFDNIFNQEVLLKLASRATGILPDDLNKMFAPEFLEVMLQVRNFFIRW
ncbi:hypothetical protein SporoP37_15875 [Sporosarcina sp. P37]|uniref:phage tail assembly protein n=1 Tax=unclassified Sporosarcina TaxID=2647733 RepID=UPI000A17FB63|nr:MULTISPECIES: phage tail assembly protein [unclassified Sporosarcina]ARK26005.1 hypothetical protein SporoP37_15875 [Sporosarcina sp. P37]PID19373.1 phage tail assembly protein [Sporosarcina sp. P35]